MRLLKFNSFSISTPNNATTDFRPFISVPLNFKLIMSFYLSLLKTLLEIYLD